MMGHYRIMHRTTKGEPSCALVEVLYNDDGSIAKTMEPLFVGVSPQEVLHDLGAALTEATCTTPIRPEDIVGYRDDIIPF